MELTGGIVMVDLSCDLRKLKMRRLGRKLERVADFVIDLMVVIALLGGAALVLLPQASEWLQVLVLWLAG